MAGLKRILGAKDKTDNEQAKEAIERLEKIYRILEAYGLQQYVTFDLGMLSHYEYYTGVIFKAYTYGTGEAIATGGRYDNLLSQFGKKTPAIGFAFVLDELMLALQQPDMILMQRGKIILFCYGLPTERKPQYWQKIRKKTWVCASHEEKSGSSTGVL